MITKRLDLITFSKFKNRSCFLLSLSEVIMNQNSNDLKSMNIGDILDYSVEAFKQNFKGLLLLSLILYIPWIVFYSITVNLVLGNQMSNLLDMYKNIFSGQYSQEMFNYTQETPAFQSVITLIMSLLQGVYMLTFKLILNAAVIKMIYDFAISGQVTVNNFSEAIKLIKGCFRFLPKLMGNAVLFVLILGAVYFASVLIATLAIIIPVAVRIVTGLPSVVLGLIMIALIVLAFIGIVFCIAFFAIKLIFGANTIVLEGKSVFESIKRSFYLTKGKFWHIAFASIFAFLLYYLFGVLLVGGSFLLVFVNKTVYIVANAFMQMCGALIEPFIMIYITFLFINMKVQKEGLDLEVKMRKLIEHDRKRMNNGDGETANV